MEQAVSSGSSPHSQDDAHSTLEGDEETCQSADTDTDTDTNENDGISDNAHEQAPSSFVYDTTGAVVGIDSGNSAAPPVAEACDSTTAIGTDGDRSSDSGGDHNGTNGDADDTIKRLLAKLRVVEVQRRLDYDRTSQVRVREKVRRNLHVTSEWPCREI